MLTIPLCAGEEEGGEEGRESRLSFQWMHPVPSLARPEVRAEPSSLRPVGCTQGEGRGIVTTGLTKTQPPGCPAYSPSARQQGRSGLPSRLLRPVPAALGHLHIWFEVRSCLWAQLLSHPRGGLGSPKPGQPCTQQSPPDRPQQSLAGGPQCHQQALEDTRVENPWDTWRTKS